MADATAQAAEQAEIMAEVARRIDGDCRDSDTESADTEGE